MILLKLYVLILLPETRSLRGSPVDLPVYSTVHGRVVMTGSSLLLLPLLGRLALGCPGVDGSDLLLQGGVDGTMPLERVLPGELG